MLTSDSQENRVSNLTATPERRGGGGLSINNAIVNGTPLFPYIRPNIQATTELHSPVKKAQTCCQPHIKTGSDPLHNSEQGPFYFALVKVALMPSCQNLSVIDWLSGKKFSMKRV